MAFLGMTFDPNAVEPKQDFTPLPSGEYVAQIIDSDMKPTRAGTGQYLELTFQVVDGPMQGRLVWSRLNLDNPNAQAVQIAQQDLSAICHAIGHLQAVTDSTVLHNRPMVIRVEYREGSGNYGPSNEVKGYKRIEGAPAAQPAQPAAQGSPFAPPAQAPAQAPSAAAAAPAWATRTGTG